MEPTTSPSPIGTTIPPASAVRPASGVACLPLETVEGTLYLTLQALDAPAMRLLDRLRVYLLGRDRSDVSVQVTTLLDAAAFVENLKGDVCDT